MKWFSRKEKYIKYSDEDKLNKVIEKIKKDIIKEVLSNIPSQPVIIFNVNGEKIKGYITYKITVGGYVTIKYYKRNLDGKKYLDENNCAVIEVIKGTYHSTNYDCRNNEIVINVLKKDVKPGELK